MLAGVAWSLLFQHFVQHHAQAVGACVAQLQIGRGGLRNFIGEIQRGQNGNAQ
jgi:hypothetical protein